MCEVLVKAFDNEGDDLQYKANDPISLGLDGKQWGTAECPPLFYLIKLAGIPHQQISPYFVGDITGPEDNQILLKPRLYTWDLDNQTFRNKNTDELVVLPIAFFLNQINSENTFYTATIE